MDNFSTNSGRKSVQDLNAVNSFLVKTYWIMGLAVLVSALTAYLATNVWVNSLAALFSNAASAWTILLLPLILTFFISFRATRNPVASFIMLMVMAVAYGLTFAVICMAYAKTTIASAFVASAAVFVTMAIYGSVTKRDLSNLGSYAFAALIGLLVATVVNLFLQNSIVAYVFSYIGVIIFTLLTAWDAQKMKTVYAQYASQTSELGLATAGALELYLDFVNIFMYFIQIFGMGSNRN